ncbi:hypothetical protein Tco_1216447 [Tanacetum coccineum]
MRVSHQNSSIPRGCFKSSSFPLHPKKEENVRVYLEDTTLALTIPPPIINQAIPSQGTNVSPLASRALIFSTPHSSPLEPHPYLTTLDDLPRRNSNPPPPSLSQGLSKTLPRL